uniref:Uncharacterized protein n=1 Tax=Rhizophora mucronata TaxID=61149 RepID=A0A2P2QXU5_RHIMU
MYIIHRYISVACPR